MGTLMQLMQYDRILEVVEGHIDFVQHYFDILTALLILLLVYVFHHLVKFPVLSDKMTVSGIFFHNHFPFVLFLWETSAGLEGR